MTVEALRERLLGFAKDIRLNLSSVLKEDPSSGLTVKQIYGVALASAYATKHKDLMLAVEMDASTILSSEEIHAARSAATIMAMNNIYYRFTHLAHDADLSKLPVGLRMNVIGNPGIPKVDFELYSLAVSAINGCGLCIEAHTKTVEHGGISKHGIQHAVKIAAVLNATAQALLI